MKLIVTIEAESDMREISAYTFAQWGMEQAITYIDQIESAFLKLLDAPHIGIDCSDSFGIPPVGYSAPRHLLSGNGNNADYYPCIKDPEKQLH